MKTFGVKYWRQPLAHPPARLEQKRKWDHLTQFTIWVTATATTGKMRLGLAKVRCCQPSISHIWSFLVDMSWHPPPLTHPHPTTPYPTTQVHKYLVVTCCHYLPPPHHLVSGIGDSSGGTKRYSTFKNVADCEPDSDKLNPIGDRKQIRDGFEPGEKSEMVRWGQIWFAGGWH